MSTKKKLQDIENTYILPNESEIMAESILKILIYKTINKSRLNDLEAFIKTYTIKKIFEMTTLYASFGTLKSDIDIPSDPEDHILEEISSSKIDPLCGSRTKIIKENERNFLRDYILNNDTIYSELEKYKPIIDPEKEAEKSKEINTTSQCVNNKKMSSISNKKFRNSKKEGVNDKILRELKAQLLPKKKITSSQSNIFSEVFNATKTNNKDNQNTLEITQSNNITSSNLNKFTTLRNSKKFGARNNSFLDDYFEQFALTIEPSSEEIKESEEDVIREENLRMIFKEKEAERMRRLAEEKKNEKIMKEEAKKMQTILEDMQKKPFCFDSNGRMVNVIPPNPEKLEGLTQVSGQIMRRIENENDYIAPYSDRQNFAEDVFKLETKETEEDEIIEVKGKSKFGKNFNKKINKKKDKDKDASTKNQFNPRNSIDINFNFLANENNFRNNVDGIVEEPGQFNGGNINNNFYNTQKSGSLFDNKNHKDSIKSKGTKQTKNMDHSEVISELSLTLDSKNPKEVGRIQMKYSQGNPLRTHNIPAGVTMEYYESKKEGGAFPSIPNKLTFKEFNDLLAIYKPNYFKEKKTQSIKELYKLYESEMENSAFNTTKKKNKKNNAGSIISDDDIVYKSSEIREQLLNNTTEIDLPLINPNVVKETNPLKEPGILQKILNEKGNFKTSKNIKNKETSKNLIPTTVKATKEFKYDLLTEFNDEKIYEEFKDKEGLEKSKSNYEFTRNKKKTNTIKQTVSPKVKHIPYEKELGYLKKYPRERLPKDILAISNNRFNINEDVFNLKNRDSGSMIMKDNK